MYNYFKKLKKKKTKIKPKKTLKQTCGEKDKSPNNLLDQAEKSLLEWVIVWRGVSKKEME